MSGIDFFYEFASTYSYLTAMRIAPLAETAGVTVRWRPFLLGPIFKSQGWDTSPFNLYPAKGRYMVRDCERQCAALGLAFRLPEPFPQSTLTAARVALVGLAEGWGEDFSRAVYRAQFAEGRQIGDPSVIGELVRELGHDGAAALARTRSDEIKARLRAETEEAQRLGIFGAPSFIATGELFWGNDRLEAGARLREESLTSFRARRCLRCRQEAPMKTFPLAVSLVLALTSLADAKQTKRHKHTMKSAPAAAHAHEAGFQPRSARMIEVKPGYWISSFGCALDAGYGRFTACDLTDGNR